MIYIQRVVRFLSPRLGEGIENTQQVEYIDHIKSQTMGDSFYHTFATLNKLCKIGVSL
jgi:hypothetical protein